MAGFDGIKWASRQSCYLLKDKSFKVVASNDKVYAVSRSIHYGLFLAFEGIRFYCKKNSRGKVEIIFLNLGKNLLRFQKGIAFNLGQHQQQWVPGIDDMADIFLRYMRDAAMIEFLYEIAEQQAQGYLRPFTVDEEHSIGVTFPNNPSIRAVACRYDRYLGEPFSGVVVPNYVRACAANGTGCLKLGINYVISLKAVDAAKKIFPGAAAALLLDDRSFEAIEKRKITEWDSSCCLFALRDGTVIKIPESPLILPSVTIQGIVAILKHQGVKVIERDMTYGELVEKSKNNEVVAVCSVGTAGILNRAQQLILVDGSGKIIGEQQAEKNHELYQKLGEARNYYWDIYKEKVEVPPGLTLTKYEV